MNIQKLLDHSVKRKMIETGLPADSNPGIAICKQPFNADYQVNGLIALAKRLNKSARDLGDVLVEKLEMEDSIHSIEVSGPGFLNLTLDNKWLSRVITEYHSAMSLGYEKPERVKTVVVDYSAPNLAKEMHVGHLRSTIIGDAIALIMEYLGHNVVRQNHVGDWGTQFGMLVAEMRNAESSSSGNDVSLNDLELFYQNAKRNFDKSEEFAAKSREYVVKLQNGDKEILNVWKKFRSISISHVQEIYDLLGTSLLPEHIKGESSYNSELPIVVNDLSSAGLLEISDGAKVVFLDEIKDKDGNSSVVIVEKKGGGYLYATTDLAAIKYRAEVISADTMLYFIDDRQSLHIQQIFQLAKKANYVSNDVTLKHCSFGKMLDSNGKPFKTRDGKTVKLKDLLKEAISKAENIIRNRGAILDEAKIGEISKTIGIGAIKYSDLAKNRSTDYMFNLNQIISFDGNTGPYLQYAYTRIQSIFRKSKIDIDNYFGDIIIGNKHEKALTLVLLEFFGTIETTAREAQPHLLSAYLYRLSSTFTTFYENCPILNHDISSNDRKSRLLLCKLTSDTLQKGLSLLGIGVLSEM